MQIFSNNPQRNPSANAQLANKKVHKKTSKTQQKL
jgi:hypothetical protein